MGCGASTEGDAPVPKQCKRPGLDPQDEAKAKEEEAAAAEEWTYVYPQEEVLPEDSGNEEAESKAQQVEESTDPVVRSWIERAKAFADVDRDGEEQWDEGLVEARKLLGELELIPKEARTKELDDTVWGVTMPYCAWVMGKWGVTVHTPKEVLWDIARADPLFAKLAKIDPKEAYKKKVPKSVGYRHSTFMDERKTEDEASVEECQDVLELGDKVDSSKKIFGRAHQGQKVETYLNGPELVDNINAHLAGRLFVDPQFPANSSTIGTRAVREITGWGRPPAGHSLVKDGFEMDDIKQGGLGDCWFISICAVVAEWPEILRKMFYPVESPSPSGVYAVRVYDGSQWVWVLVDTLFPICHDRRLAFASCCDSDGLEVWPMILEKAWAKLHGCYSDMVGGAPTCIGSTRSLELITSGSAGYCKFGSFFKKSKEVENYLIYHQWKGQRIICASCHCEKDGTDQGLVSNHAYSVLGVCHVHNYFENEEDRTEEDKKFRQVLVQLRNPWGWQVWRGKWSNVDWESWMLNKRYKSTAALADVDWDEVKRTGVDPLGDGSFYMSLKDFWHHYRAIQICTVPFEREYKPAI